MKTMTIREVRQHWPEAERQLAIEKEIVITRDGKPVAKLVVIEDEVAEKRPFDPEEFRLAREKIFGVGVTVDWSKELIESREDRIL